MKLFEERNFSAMKQLHRIWAICLLILNLQEIFIEGNYSRKKLNPEFVPAMPGKTPDCLQDPGLTFCTKSYRYPEKRIRYLLEHKMFDLDSLIKDETMDTVTIEYRQPRVINVKPKDVVETKGSRLYSRNSQKHTYSPPSSKPTYVKTNVPFSYLYPPKISQKHFVSRASPVANSHASNPISSHSPFGPDHYNKSVLFAQHSINYKYGNQHSDVNYSGYKISKRNRMYSTSNYERPFSDFKHQSQNLNQNYPTSNYNTLNPYKAYWNNHYPSHNVIPYVPQLRTHQFWRRLSGRKKRQAVDPRLNNLCPVETGYLMPVAAQNIEGLWMFLVNTPNHTQYLRTQTCLSEQCSGVCEISDGFTSSCQQQFAQKRLMALHGSGEMLFTDIFWFPTCCLCLIRENF